MYTLGVVLARAASGRCSVLQNIILCYGRSGGGGVWQVCWLVAEGGMSALQNLCFL